jgi:hypothetical protein
MKEHNHHLNNLTQAGVLIDEYGLLKPNLEELEVIQNKIIPDLIVVKKLIDQLRSEGKHIVYLPGSYDLIHAGHAFYVYKSIEWYLSLPGNENLSRKDLAVLLLVDDDDLISQTKISKWVGKGGKELFQRPIQSTKAFQNLREEYNWRLLELASIPAVDIVGFIPSPLNGAYLGALEVVSAQKSFSDLELKLDEFNKQVAIPEKDTEALRAALREHESLVQMFVNDYSQIVSAFTESQSEWSIQSWQLFIHSYLALGNFPAPFVRIVSHNDSAYKYQVNFLMEVSGIQNIYINDEPMVSTTELLEKYGHEELLNAKKKNYKN